MKFSEGIIGASMPWRDPVRIRVAVTVTVMRVRARVLDTLTLPDPYYSSGHYHRLILDTIHTNTLPTPPGVFPPPNTLPTLPDPYYQSWHYHHYLTLTINPS